jgi:pimeloyl-ACP methyl ester carboxylesterase
MWHNFLNTVLFVFCLSAVACQSRQPFKRVEFSTNSNIVYGHVLTDSFEHFWAAHQSDVGGISKSKQELPEIVVIEGDGQPWRNRFQVANDPTSASPLLLEWLSVTEHTALYLGRPCYFGQREVNAPVPPVRITGQLLNKQCDAYWYTFGRYSQVVVDSLVQALQKLAAERCLILLGHSGGGTLAMLIARQLPTVSAVVTLSGNINVTAWQQYHQFTPLMGSLDPSKLSPLAARISQIHIAADQDTSILPIWISQEAQRQHAAYQLWTISGHRQWQQAWSKLDALLARLKRVTSC